MYASIGGTSVARQPLRPLSNAHNVGSGMLASKAAADKLDKPEKPEKPIKAFSVYVDRNKTAAPRPAAQLANASQPRRSHSIKRPSDSADARPTKMMRPSHVPLSRPAAAAASQQQPSMSAQQIEAIIERKVAEALAARSQPPAAAPPSEQPPQQPMQHQVSEAVQRRLEALERRIDDDDARSDGLRFLLLARQQKEAGDDEGALRSYEMALPFFPAQMKLRGKMEKLRAKLAGKDTSVSSGSHLSLPPAAAEGRPRAHAAKKAAGDADYDDGAEASADDASLVDEPRSRVSRKPKIKVVVTKVQPAEDEEQPLTPRKRRLLDIVNSRDVLQIKGLTGFGAKKAQDLVRYLELTAEDAGGRVETLAQLAGVPSIGHRVIQRAYDGLVAEVC